MNTKIPLFPDAGSRPDRRARQARPTRGAQIIKQRIKTGVYQPGESLPSLRALSSELKLSFPAMQRAVRQLESEGLLESRHGVGTRVLAGADCSSLPLFFGFIQPYFSRFSLALQGHLERTLDDRSNLCVMKSSHNSAARERREVENLLETGINGLLVWPAEGDANAAFFRDVTGRVPLVFVDRTVEDVAAPSVTLDFAGFGRQLIRQECRAGRRKILVVCDSAKISSYLQLKAALRDEAAKMKISETVTILDYPVVKLIEAAYLRDYRRADIAYKTLAPMLQSGDYDTLFCPQNEFLEHVFIDYGRAATLSKVHCITLESVLGPQHSRLYYEMPIERWNHGAAMMLVTALDELQDITMTRSTRKRPILIPITKRESEMASEGSSRAAL